MNNTKAFERKTTQQLVKLHAEESKLNILQAELSRNPQFIQFLEAQKKLQKKTDDFWKEVKGQMMDNHIKQVTIDTDFVTGKLSLTYIQGYEAADISKVDKKFVIKTLDAKAVAAQVIATGEIPDGVDEKGFYRLNKALKSKDIVS